jgi:hypothetical protein
MFISKIKIQSYENIDSILVETNYNEEMKIDGEKVFSSTVFTFFISFSSQTQIKIKWNFKKNEYVEYIELNDYFHKKTFHLTYDVEFNDFNMNSKHPLESYISNRENKMLNEINQKYFDYGKNMQNEKNQNDLF